MKSIKDLPSFSVIIPSWKRPDHLKACIASILTQDYSGHFEIIVVLRDEDTASREVVLKAQSKMNSEFPKITIAPAERPGFVSALRSGFRFSTSEIVSFCDDDAIYPPNWLDKLAKEFEDATTGGAGGPIKEGGAWQGEVDAPNVSKVNFFGKVIYNVRAKPNFDAPIHVASLPGANMAFQRRLLDVSVFDPALDGPSYAPGNELVIGWSVRNQGYLLNYVPDCPVEHFSAPWIESSRTAVKGKAEQYGHNLAYAHARFANRLRLFVYVVGALIYGERIAPGLVRILSRAIRGQFHELNSASIMRAKLTGIRTGLRMRKLDKLRLKECAQKAYKQSQYSEGDHYESR